MSQSAALTRFLNTSRDGESTASLGSLFQCLTTLSVKTFFLISSLNLPWRNLRPNCSTCCYCCSGIRQRNNARNCIVMEDLSHTDIYSGETSISWVYVFSLGQKQCNEFIWLWSQMWAVEQISAPALFPVQLTARLRTSLHISQWKPDKAYELSP